MKSEQGKSIIGADIIKNGGDDLSSYIYALALVRNGKVVKIDEGSLGRLIRLLWENRPSTLAVDNLLELGGSKRNVLKILKLLPPETEVIQVTLKEGKGVSLKELTSRVDASLGKEKPSAVRTAIILAFLAGQGIGERLKVFKNKVKVSVYPGRSGYAGGSRSDKFRRNLRSAVAQVVKRIKGELDKAGIDYDLAIRRSKGGIDKAYFIVYSSRERLYGLIRRVRGRDVMVRIRPIINRGIFSIDYEKAQSKYLIVGYDPGIKIGLAALDLEGRPVLITSGKSLDREDITSLLVKYGRPLIISTDKNPPPEMVRKLASMLKVRLYVPPRSLTTGEKELISGDFSRKHGISVRNTHERDALSAAVKAYRVYEEKLRKLIKKVKSMNLPISLKIIETYKVRILKDESLSEIIEDMINDVVKDNPSLGRPSSVGGEYRNPYSKDRESMDSQNQNSLLQRLEEVTKERDMYKVRISVLNDKVRELMEELARVTSSTNERVLRDRKIKELLQRLNNLEQQVLRLRSESQRQAKLLQEHAKLFEGLLSRKLVLVPSFRAKCMARQSQHQSVFYVDNPESLSEETYLKIRGRGISILLPPGREDLADYLVRAKLIPSSTVRSVWSLGTCVRIVEGEALKRLQDSLKVVTELKKREEESRLSMAKLEDLVRQYRLSRVKVLRDTTRDSESNVNM